MSPRHEASDVIVIGAGIVGITIAHALCARGARRLTLIDALAPMSLTSAKSGENFRTWWPQPELAALMARSIELMDAFCDAHGVRVTRRGYAYASRAADPHSAVDAMRASYAVDAIGGLRVHADDGVHYRSGDYHRPNALAGADVLIGQPLIERHFPALDPTVTMLTHVRQAGDVDSAQMASQMLSQLRDTGAVLQRGAVQGIERDGAGDYRVTVRTDVGDDMLTAGALVNAAGPFAGRISTMLGVTLPLVCVAQQKLAFEDSEQIVPRDAPFTIDLDPQQLAFDDDEREMLAASEDTAWLLERFPGGIHCRPEGGATGRWIKLGWAFNQTPAEPQWESPLLEHFPEIVIRGAARLRPGLGVYLEHLPRARTHYGGFYTKTRENWPIVGAMDDHRAYVAAGLSGYGTMAACAVAELIALHVDGDPLPEYARALSLERYQDAALMKRIEAATGSGEL